MSQDPTDAPPGPQELSRAVPGHPSAAREPLQRLGEFLGPPTQAPLTSLADVALSVEVRLGQIRKTLAELLQIGPGSLVELDCAPDSPVEVLVGDRVVARGLLVMVGGQLGVRITEVASEGGNVPE